MRDNFTRDVIETLTKRAGGCCSNPVCRQPTSGPNTEPSKAVNVGVAAHICAASPGGPRFDPAMTPEERAAIANAILLCQKCGKLVDSDVRRYTVSLLQGWKRDRESEALAAIEGRSAASTPALAPVEVRLLRLNQNIASRRHDHQLEVEIQNIGSTSLSDFHVDLEMPRAPVHRPESMHLLVPSRSTSERAFFRMVMARHRPREVLYPGDSLAAITVQYFMDDALFDRKDTLFAMPVRATVYVAGYAPVTCEKLFEEMQMF